MFILRINHKKSNNPEEEGGEGALGADFAKRAVFGSSGVRVQRKGRKKRWPREGEVAKGSQKRGKTFHMFCN